MEEGDKKIYLKCKYKVKKWESDFKQAHGTNPSKTDIKEAPGYIKEAYRTYWKLKTISLETSLVDLAFGDEITLDGFSTESTQNRTQEEFISRGGDLDVHHTVSNEESSKQKDKKEESSNTVDVENTQNTNENAADLKESEKCANKDSVWGPHLSNTNKKVEEKPKKEIPAVLSHFTAKLFAGATFKKRNPRKSLIRKHKSDNSTLQYENSQNSITSDTRQNASQPEICSTFEEKSTVSEEILKPFRDEDSQNGDLCISKFKIVSGPQTQNQSQPVSLLHKTLMSNTSVTSLSVSRTVDSGWLERLDKITTLDVGSKVNSSDSGIELTDSSVVSLEPKSSPLCTTGAQDNQISDNEDFVCDSDSEGNRSRSFSSFISSTQTRSFSRIPSLTHSDFKRTSSSLSSLNELKNVLQVSKPEKRTFDHVVSEIVDNDSKKCKIDGKLSRPVPADEIENKPSNVGISPCIIGFKVQTNLESLTTEMATKSLWIENKKPKTKEMRLEETLRKKVSSGKANENFVKINIKKKVYVRGKKTMTFQKYKKQKWKEAKKGHESYSNERGVYKCFKCGDVGHFAKNCLKASDQLLPLEDIHEEDESPFPTLQEAEDMALEASKNLRVRRNLNDLPVHVANGNVELDNVAVPPPVQSDDIMRFTVQEAVFKLNEDGSLIDTPLVVLETLMKFGHEQWRPGQETAVMRVLSGLNTLVTLSTGSGKSLCYQLPAYLYHTIQGRITLVVSPLVSLMEDQVYGVPACMRVACLHTNQSPKERDAVYEQLRANSLQVLLVSPEALAVGDHVSELLRSLPLIAFACIDEAHCISQWSHNFRPSYLMVCQVLREKFGVKTILGLTATASLATIASISTTLALPDGLDGVIRDTPLPDNLRLSVSRDRNKDQALIKLLQGERFNQCRSIIVYCTRRDVCQRLAAYIRTCLQDVSKEDGKIKRGKLSWNAEAYHAGLTAARRRAVQKAFMSGKTRIVVATVAFGMGINKQDIQGIIHYNMPNAFERYVQEVGRAGRDGQTAHCHLFLDTEGEDLSELRRHIYADSVERHIIRKLLQRVFVPCSCGTECPSHEVAFSVDETVMALDLPEENISTLLCYLELHARQWVHVCSRAYTQCRVLSYMGPKMIRQALKECPPLAVAVAMAVNNGMKLDKVSKLEFPIFPVAAAIKWDSGIVKQQLKKLEWTTVNEKPRRSGLTVEFHDLGFRVQAPGNLCGEELDAALDSLTTRVEAQETKALRQLQAIFDTLMQVSHTSVDKCLDDVDKELCEKLKTNIRQYFTEEGYLDNHNIPEVTLHNERQVVGDIRDLVNSYQDVNFSGRAVARIFHGIASPNYPARQWGRCRFWRSHLNEDFKLLSKLATQELIKMR